MSRFIESGTQLAELHAPVDKTKGEYFTVKRFPERGRIKTVPIRALPIQAQSPFEQNTFTRRRFLHTLAVVTLSTFAGVELQVARNVLGEEHQFYEEEAHLLNLAQMKVAPSITHNFPELIQIADKKYTIGINTDVFADTAKNTRARPKVEQ